MMSPFRTTLAVLLLLAAGAAHSQTYPAKPVRMVVPWPPGGTNDILGRALAEPLGRALNQQVIIDNRGGSNGVIGADVVARAPGDGYTIMFHSITSHVTNPAVYSKLSYDTVRDFTPITQIAWVPLVIVAHPSFPARNVRELVAIAKAQPGQVNYASFGQGSMSHLAGELLKMMAKIDIAHIPYKGGGPALIDALAGHVPVYFSSIAPSLPHLKTGRLRALGLTGSERSKQLPNVATVAETPGLKGYDATIMYAVWAPAKTPPQIVNTLHAAIVKVIQTPQFRERLEFEGASAPIGGSPEQMAAAIQADMKKLARLVQVSGLKPQ
jgi:tripartite-type tricarboxylate transporter receptor subunit TctC